MQQHNHHPPPEPYRPSDHNGEDKRMKMMMMPSGKSEYKINYAKVI